MDATRCIIVHLAATQSLQHTIGDRTIPLWYYGLVVGVVAVILVQVSHLSYLLWELYSHHGKFLSDVKISMQTAPSVLKRHSDRVSLVS